MERVETYKRLRKNPLSIVGATGYERKPVISGFFMLVDGQGLPLDIVLRAFEERGYVPCWLTFFMEAIERGWNPQSTLTKIQMACEDVYSVDHAEKVVKKLREHTGI